MTRCPTCDSPAPNLHPAVQAGGEVQPCRDAYHEPLSDDARRALDATPTTAGRAEVRAEVERLRAALGRIVEPNCAGVNPDWQREVERVVRIAREALDGTP